MKVVKVKVLSFSKKNIEILKRVKVNAGFLIIHWIPTATNNKKSSL